VVDVVEDHGVPLRGDLAREAAADRDAHAPFDLLLDAFRGAGDELGLRLVDQQESGRVGMQRLANPQEQLLEQLVEREVRERNVGDGLQVSQAVGRV